MFPLDYEKIQFPIITSATKYSDTSIPFIVFGPPNAVIPLYITVFQSSPVIIYKIKNDQR